MTGMQSDIQLAVIVMVLCQNYPIEEVDEKEIDGLIPIARICYSFPASPEIVFCPTPEVYSGFPGPK